MINMNKTIIVLDQIYGLLSSVNENNWSFAIKSLSDRCKSLEASEFEIVRSDLLRIYGGMGSFSDLVLYSEGQVLIKENQKLDSLRKELFNLISV